MMSSILIEAGLLIKRMIIGQEGEEEFSASTPPGEGLRLCLQLITIMFVWWTWTSDCPQFPT
ncbi:hypothetical protein CTI14_01685 [Methylobacterium radiotolerans]|nr:hypothetical protein CTI14_01685 [Methylobacterium radiotolerans]